MSFGVPVPVPILRCHTKIGFDSDSTVHLGPSSFAADTNSDRKRVCSKALKLRTNLIMWTLLAITIATKLASKWLP